MCLFVGVLFFLFFFFFFFKQKTAYEIGTGDWSSDVCSSDLFVSKWLNCAEDRLATVESGTANAPPSAQLGVRYADRKSVV